MIETSALPAIAKLLCAAAPSGETGEESPISAQFAQLLSLQLGTGPAGGDAPAAAETLPSANPHPANGKHRGKPGGKSLPELPPSLAGAAEPNENCASPAAGDPLPESPAAPIQLPPSEAPAAGLAIVAAPLPPVTAPDAGRSAASEAHFSPLAKALPAMPDILRLAQGGSQAPKTGPAAPFSRQAPRTDAGQAGSAPQPAHPQVRLVSLDTNAPNAVPPKSVAPVRLIVPKGAVGEGSVLHDTAEPLSSAEPVTSAKPAGDSLPVSRATQLAASLRQLLARFDVDAPEARASTPAGAPVETMAASPGLVPAGPELLAPPSPDFTNAKALAAAAQATSPAPVTIAEAPRDFAQLIDRLVEARDALRSTQAPHTVEAAIAHAEFGQVSLRFEQDGGALSVSLASPDPDFARAVQAAAPASQQAPGQDNAATPQRQDNPGQQSPGTGAGQPQSQQRGQAAPQPVAEPRDRPAPQARHDGEARPPRRNGIFA